MNKIMSLCGICVIVIVIATVLIPITERENDPLCVIVYAGQSQVVYSGDTTYVNAAGLPPSNCDVLYYGTAEKPFSILHMFDMDYDHTFNSYNVYSMLNDSRTAWRVGSTDAAMAYEITKEHDTSVLIINTGIGGAPISFLKPGAEGGAVIDGVVKDAMSKIPEKYNVYRICFVWNQGESDASTPINTYVQDFDIIDNHFHKLGFDTGYIIQTRAAIGGNATAAQALICENEKDVFMATTIANTFTVENGMIISDGIHYSDKARFVVGIETGKAIDIPEFYEQNDLITVIPLVVICSVIVLIAGLYFRRD